MKQRKLGSQGLVVSAEGLTTLYYWSIDASGNMETPKTSDVRVDKTMPGKQTALYPSDEVRSWVKRNRPAAPIVPAHLPAP